jgi:Tol biopolymer transport system component
MVPRETSEIKVEGAMGQHIAFAMLDDNPQDGWDIYTIHTQTGNVRRLTYHLNAAEFAWSPDGRRVAVVSQEGKRRLVPQWFPSPGVDVRIPSRLRIMDVDGTQSRAVFEDKGWLRHITWLPDGEHLSFLAFQHGEAGLYQMKVDGSERRLLARDVQEYQWSADGRQVLFHHFVPREKDLWLMEADGTQKRCVAQIDEDASNLAWSPTGQQIAFTSFSDDEEGFRQHLCVMNLDGSGVRRVAELPNFDETAFSWSPDGPQLAFLATVEATLDLALAVVNADGSQLRHLVEDIQSDAEYLPDPPIWSPDGQQLAFLSWVEEREEHLYLINADGTGRRCLTEGTPFTRSKLNLAWQP